MNLFKRVTALFLSLVLMTGLLPVHTLADQQETTTFKTTHINPYYVDIISADDLRPAATPSQQTYDTPNYVTTVEEAGKVLAPQMEAREEIATVYIITNELTQESFNALVNEILSAAFVHTGVPTEGDYIHWHYAGCHVEGEFYSSDAGYHIALTYTFTYHSNAQQETQVDTAVAQLLSELDLSGKSDYEKVKTVYDYICANVRYDHSTSESTLKHSAYAALINKTAVCQGYALLLYRLMLELGIDCRFIAGTGGGGLHGWNIIELDGLYYNADATWDEGLSDYNWFLKCEANFYDHTRDEEYTTSAFHSAHPMSPADYVPSSGTDASEGILINSENFPDANFRAYLLDQDYGADALLTEEEIAVITWIDVSEMSIASLEGIAYFTELAELYCDVNELTSLDLKYNTALTHLFCAQNQISALDLSSNTALKYAFFGYNNLSSLIIGSNSGLLQLGCDYNNLTELDVSGAPSLSFLGCTNNQLTTLDVSKNPALTELECSNNQLTSLDLSRNTALTELLCSGNAYSIAVNESNQFDLTTLPGNFDVSKASSWSGGSVSGSTLTAEKETISYSYDLGNGETATFTLRCTLSEVHSHLYTATVTDPTCTEEGYTTYTCSCGDTRITEYVDALGHDYAEEVTAPTCLEGGYTTFLCSRCGDTYVGNETEATGHQHEAVVTAPTCTEGGYTTYTCVCGDTYTGNETDPTGHDYATRVVPPTCTEEGYTTYICINCSDTYDDDFVSATGHNYTAVITDPTCTEQGYTTYTCACGDTNITSYVDALGHTEVVDEALAATCTETGLTEGTHCSVCEEILIEQEETPALGHSFGNWATNENQQQRVCDRCGFTENKITTNGGNVEIEASEQSNLDFDVVYVEPEEEQYILVEEAISNAENNDYKILKVFDITLKNAGGVHVQPSGTVKIKLPLDHEAEGSYKVYRVNDDGSLTDMAAAQQGSHMVFETDHLSLYVIAVAAPISVQRIYGTGRVETALGVADALKEALGVEKFDAIIIANGENDNFADALTGSYLANKKGAPILLYRKSGMSELNLEYIANNLSSNGTIYLLGGTGVIPADVEESLAGYTIKRLAGTTRFDTNLAILKEAGVTDEEILIARGFDFADSLSASASGLPILVVNEVTSKLTDAQIEYLKQLDGNKMTIIGGPAIIKTELEEQIEEIIGAQVDRLYGDLREDTSVMIAEEYIDTPDFAVVAYSRTSPDGLCGGPLAYAKGAPLLLTNVGHESKAAKYVAEEEIAAGYILGGEAIVSDETARAIFGLSENAVINTK